jgi:hypothetical protein
MGDAGLDFPAFAARDAQVELFAHGACEIVSGKLLRTFRMRPDRAESRNASRMLS